MACARNNLAHRRARPWEFLRATGMLARFCIPGPWNTTPRRAAMRWASGENMWFTSDAFQFVWKKMSGDITLTADISFLGKSAQEHRKAVLMVRQSLDADSPYADVTLHGNGMTALQYRDEKSALTHEIQAVTWSPKRLRIEKHGDFFTMWLAYEDGAFPLAGGSARLAFKEPFDVGIGLCSHDKDAVEKAVFSNVELKAAAPPASAATTLFSMLEVI